MTGCKDKKRVQLYLDGWMDDSETGRFELHLRGCPECQAELINLEEAASSALEIVDQAPDAKYWDNFSNRLLNRIIARNVSPYASRRERSRSLRLRIGSYAAAITTFAAAVLLIFGYVTRSPQGVGSPAVSDQVTIVPDTILQEVPVADVVDVRQTVPEENEPEGSSPGVQLSAMPANESPGPTLESQTAIVGDLITADPGVKETETPAEDRFNDRFRDAYRRSQASLALDGDYGFLDRLMSVYNGRGSDGYRLDQETVAEALLSGYGP